MAEMVMTDDAPWREKWRISSEIRARSCSEPLTGLMIGSPMSGGRSCVSESTRGVAR